MTTMRIDLPETGRNIEFLRRRNHISVKEVQTTLGFNTPQAIYKWQRGECLPALENLVVLAYMFHVSIDEIIVLVDETPAQAA